MAQSLLELKECTRQGDTELQQLEVELQRTSKEDTCVQARLRYPLLCPVAAQCSARVPA